MVNVKKEQRKFQSTVFVYLFLLGWVYCHARAIQTFIPANCLFHLHGNSRKLRLSQIAKAACATSLKLKERMYYNNLLKYLF